MSESNKNSNLTPAEQYCNILMDDEPRYYSRVPAILYHCTYIEDIKDKEGNIIGQERKKLSPHAIALYGYLKQLAGNKHKSWASREHLAKMTGMSVGSITNAKKELSQKMEQLNGKSFIRIEKKKHMKYDEKRNQRCSTPYDEVWIEKIWGENNAYMETLKFQENLELGTVDNSTSMSYSDDEPPPQCHIMTECNRGSMSHSDTNKNQCNKKQSDKELEAVASPPDLTLSTSNNLTDSAMSTRTLVDEIEQTRHRLQKIGCDEGFINFAMKTYTTKQINDAGYKMRQILESGKTIENRIGYFRRLLEKGF